MPDFRSKSPNDCVPIALSNFFDLLYDEVATAVEYRPGKGSPSSKTTDFLKSHGMVEMPVPRRGQEKMNGIIRTCSKGSKFYACHVAVVRHGIVFDSIAPDGLPIKEYKKLVRNSRITGYWIGERVKKIESPKQQSEPIEDITQWLDDLLGA